MGIQREDLETIISESLKNLNEHISYNSVLHKAFENLLQEVSKLELKQQQELDLKDDKIKELEVSLNKRNDIYYKYYRE